MFLNINLNESKILISSSIMMTFLVALDFIIF